MSEKRGLALDTHLIHAGRGDSFAGAAVTPIFRSTVYSVEAGTPYHQIRYPRLSNSPNHQQLCAKLATLEGAEASMVTASGMAAISTGLLAHLRAGDHLLVQEQLYGGTHALVHEDLPALGIEVDSIDACDPSSWQSLLRPGKTRAIYVEAMSNPLVQVANHPEVVAFARRHQLLSIIDSTFAPPVNFQPATLGYDLVMHSATKYLNGHSDLICGAISGSREVMQPVTRLLGHLGGMLDPQGCFLLDRGLKTLGMRVRRQNDSAQAIAEFLASHPHVRQINYPGLPSHPQHRLATQLFKGYGGMLSFELAGGAEVADRFLGSLALAFNGPSLGGVETLVTRPATTSHAGVPAASRQRLGIGDGLIRMSVGIEDQADLIHDCEQALAAIG
jgi:cystathionine gamma-synthase/cystathionine gamma-lyase/cystathionine beta-lyase